MKRALLSILFAIVGVAAFAQTSDDNAPKPATLDDLCALVENYVGQAPQNYELYETSNMWTFLRLDTRTGKIWQVQYSVEGPEYRFESELNTIDLTYGDNSLPGRFALYKTQNIYNFILLDKEEGRTWQVQWGKVGSRQLLRIY